MLSRVGVVSVRAAITHVGGTSYSSVQRRACICAVAPTETDCMRYVYDSGRADHTRTRNQHYGAAAGGAGEAKNCGPSVFLLILPMALRGMLPVLAITVGILYLAR